MKSLLLTLFVLIIPYSAYAGNNCFVAKQEGIVVKEEGACNLQHSPCSSFKIPLAVIGFDAGILKSPQEPVLEYTDEAKKRFSAYHNPAKYPIHLLSARAQTPATWMKYSVVWYSQEITQRLGMEKFAKYVRQLGYGNRDVSGTPGKNNGLTASWLSGSSLRISPREQVEFMEKLSQRKLPVSIEAQENAIKIIYLGYTWDDWHLYGKTGSSGAGGGWFVGWIEKGERRVVFAQYVETKEKLLPGGRVAKEVAQDNLLRVVMR